MIFWIIYWFHHFIFFDLQLDTAPPLGLRWVMWGNLLIWFRILLKRYLSQRTQSHRDCYWTARTQRGLFVGFVLILEERFRIRTHQALTGDCGIKRNQIKQQTLRLRWIQVFCEKVYHKRVNFFLGILRLSLIFFKPSELPSNNRAISNDSGSISFRSFQLL